MNYTVTFAEVDNGYDTRTYLQIHYNGKLIQEECDGGEPEDNSFDRDWNWVAKALVEAYNLGYKDGGYDRIKDLELKIKAS